MPDPYWLQGESRRLEFKETWPEGDNIVGTAVAFANGAGGRIVSGVRPTQQKPEDRRMNAEYGQTAQQEGEEPFAWIREKL